MALTIEQLGQSIKRKYPQYNDIPDAELGKKMLAKYPQHSDMLDVGSETPAVEKTDSSRPIKEKETSAATAAATGVVSVDAKPAPAAADAGPRGTR